MILVFWMLSFKPTFSLSSFTFIKRLFGPSSLSAIRVVSSAYLRLLIPDGGTKISQAVEHLSPWATTREPTCHNYWGLSYWALVPQLENPCATIKTHMTAKIPSAATKTWCSQMNFFYFQIRSSVTVASAQALSSYTRLVVAILDNTDYRTFPSLQKILLDSAGLHNSFILSIFISLSFPLNPPKDPHKEVSLHPKPHLEQPRA